MQPAGSDEEADLMDGRHRKTLRIRDSDDHLLSVDLRHILAALAPRASTSWWTVSGVASEAEPLMATGPRSDELDELEQSGRRIRGDALQLIANGVRQVIWGRFEGFDTRASNAPWAVITAFDSTWFDVGLTDEADLARIKAAFVDVQDVAEGGSAVEP
jgi:hypothetical protein